MHIILVMLIMLMTGCEQKADLPESQTEEQQSVPQKSKSIQMISRVNTDSIPILMYHSIGLNDRSTLFVPPKVFNKQMEHLKNAGYHTMTFKDLINWKTEEVIPDKPILITFDDGYLDNFTIVYPILKRLQMKATIFVTSDFIGFPNHLNWGQIKEMEQSGCIEIGVHTRHHLDLTKNNPLQLVDEVWGAKQRLEKRLGHPMIAFAYPSGKFNHKVVEAVKRAGFEFAVTTQPGYAVKKQGFLTLHRVRISRGQSMDAFIREFP
ncbi:polysaccharide deacetylase family protein [Paenibacillus sediminis]|uniref:Peptidoglycan/xylan/chitin deacetylase (PgdA/CDA1 family) n=1 Tax=Paenibacillus sediminis TaxID=664909 RepID=A0ABS4H3T0_9BACL|nr:polysaccharide deacetylase family protein [Paenibacillus sediminis]MBP1937189.1 peptidoglycan/xylan/chitin deacetylase (PgdA/CDA1 family) [Paenibacillus sediminis]